MANSAVSIQDTFLNCLCNSKMSVTVFLISGFRFQGVVTDFDNFMILMNCDNKQQMVFKHAISTIIPSEAVKLSGA